VEVVVNLHLRPYYGDEDETDGFYNSEAKTGTTAFHAYAILYTHIETIISTQSGNSNGYLMRIGKGNQGLIMTINGLTTQGLTEMATPLHHVLE
jgi:hypothetical protein